MAAVLSYVGLLSVAVPVASHITTPEISLCGQVRMPESHIVLALATEEIYKEAGRTFNGRRDKGNRGVFRSTRPNVVAPVRSRVPLREERNATGSR